MKSIKLVRRNSQHAFQTHYMKKRAFIPKRELTFAQCFFHSERMPHESVGSIRNNFFAACCLSSAACYLRMFTTNLCGTLQAMMHVNGQINLNLYNLRIYR